VTLTSKRLYVDLFTSLECQFPTSLHSSVSSHRKILHKLIAQMTYAFLVANCAVLFI
jgi:hypothetical protein